MVRGWGVRNGGQQRGGWPDGWRIILQGEIRGVERSLLFVTLKPPHLSTPTVHPHLGRTGQKKIGVE